ncbi:MAG: hypothetical protein M0013_06365 [Actinomycetota bacterium]|nr:hypothetical protein [Actinomycetota bacterium]
MSLGYPLAGLYLPPGDPGALRSAARRFVKHGEALRTSGQVQRRAIDAVTGETWKGSSAEQAHAAVTKTVAAYGRGADLAEQASGALHHCASRWEAAQTEWRAACELAEQAMAEEAQMAALAAAASHGVGVFEVFVSPDRARSRAMAERAISDVTTASHHLAGHLDDLARQMRATPAFLPQPHTPWYEDPLHWGRDALHDVGSAFGDAWSWTEANAGNLAKSAFDVLGMAGSAGLAALGGIAAGGGLALDATGAGAVVGVPVDALGVVGVAAGAGGVGYFGHELSKDLIFHEARSQVSIQSDPGYGARPQPGDGTPAGGNAYNPDVADQVPAWGENGAKTSGMLEVGDRAPVEITSGESNLTAALKDLPDNALQGTGLRGDLQTHVEAQTAIYMRLDGIDNATLYINRAFCGTDSWQGCSQFFQRFLAKGQTVTVYGPNGGVVVVGTGPQIPGLDG